MLVIEEIEREVWVFEFGNSLGNIVNFFIFRNGRKKERLKGDLEDKI